MKLSKRILLGYLIVIVGLVVTVAVTIILTPLLYAAGGYFFGWMMVNLFKFAGNWFVQGAAYVGLDIHVEALPVLFSFLGVMGSFFRSWHTHPR